MTFKRTCREQFQLALETSRSIVLIAPVSVVTGCACALFLWSLDEVSLLFARTPGLLFALPVAGIVVSWLYHRFGQKVEGGNNLIIEQIHQPGSGVPGRMAPLILVTTLITHLCGGSAGREGTAVQMGGSIASVFGRLYQRVNWLMSSDVNSQVAHRDWRLLLMAGIAAGFAGVFGTPLAGTIFALEVLTLGRLNYAALIPCAVAALIGDWSCSVWGIQHSHYSVAALPAPAHASLLIVMMCLQAGLVGIACGWVSACFAVLTHDIQKRCRQWISNSLLRPVCGATLLIALTYLIGTRDYLGLGVTAFHADQITIKSCFVMGGASVFSWFWKLLFTSITLGTGFKGGEVTPLFFIGAAVGYAMAVLLGAPVDLFAAIGFVAVFAGATNTPLACTVMAIELFGSEHALYYALGCWTAYLASGHQGIYAAQRIGQSKTWHQREHEGRSLNDVRNDSSRL